MMGEYKSTDNIIKDSSSQLNSQVTSSNSNHESKWKRIFSPQMLIYTSHFLSSWGDRMWLFAGGLFLYELTPGSLRLVAIYEAAISITVITVGATVGRWVDRNSRLKVPQISLFIQNLMVVLCTILLCFLLTYTSYFETSLNGYGRLLAETGVVIMACVAQVGTLGAKLAIEKDWIIVIAEVYNTNLSKMNSVLRTVDLSTEMIAPVIVGFVMSGSGMVAGGVLIAIWNVCSFAVEYGTLLYLFRTTAALRKEKDAMKLKEDSTFIEKIKSAVNIWRRYFTHNIRNAGLALAILYLTVLALDNYTRAYIYENGVGKGLLGILTAFASFSGIVGSIAFPILRRKVGVIKTGLIGFGSESFFLIFCVIAMFVPGTLFVPSAIWTEYGISNISQPLIENADFAANSSFNSSNILADSMQNYTNVPYMDLVNSTSSNDINSDNSFEPASAILFLFGVITSRFGLWVADLSVTQIMQEDVAEIERGAINGVQYSLNQLFNLFRAILLIILPSVQTFGYLVILSFFSVCIGLILFVTYSMVRKLREVSTDTEDNLEEIKEVQNNTKL